MKKYLPVFIVFMLSVCYTTEAQTVVPYLKKNGSYVYVDSATMKPISQTEYGYARSFRENLAIFWQFKTSSPIYGCIDKKGKEIVPAQKYAEIKDFREGLALVTVKVKVTDYESRNKYGYINTLGREVIPARYDETGEPLGGMVAVALKGADGKLAWGAFTTEGKEIVPPEYISKYSDGKAIRADKRGFAIVEDNGKCGVMDKTGKIIVPVIYEFIRPDDEGFVAGRDGKCGKFSSTGQEVCPMIYEDIGSGSYNNHRNVKKEGKWGVVDKDGKAVIPCIYDKMLSFYSGLAVVKKEGKWGYIDGSGKEVIPIRYDDVNSFRTSDLSDMKMNNKYGAINTKGEEVLPAVYDEVKIVPTGGSPDVLIRVKLNNQYGFFDSKGKEVMKAGFFEAGEFSEGMTAMGTGTNYNNVTYAYYNTAGNPVIPGPFTKALKFKNGLAVVRKQGGGYGFIDKTGKEVIPLKYSQVYEDTFDNGFALVKTDKDFYIDRNGREYREQ